MGHILSLATKKKKIWVTGATNLNRNKLGHLDYNI